MVEEKLEVERAAEDLGVKVEVEAEVAEAAGSEQ